MQKEPEQTLSGQTDKENAFLEISSSQGQQLLILKGEWTTLFISDVAKKASNLATAFSGSITISLADVTGLDTAGALLINDISSHLETVGLSVVVSSNNDRYLSLLNTSKSATQKDTSNEHSHSKIVLLLNDLGKYVTTGIQGAGEILGFFGKFVSVFSYLLLHPKKIRWISLFSFMEQCGVKAIPIVSLLSFLIGMVVAYMGMEELAKFGAQLFSIKLLEVTVFREMGVLITSIVVAGRSSSSFTAQIGSMVANEEVSAIRSMGLDSMVLLVFPRITGLILTLPMLVFIADIMAVLGGSVAVCLAQDISFHVFFDQLYNGAKLWNFLVGLIKSPVCALGIGVIGCYHGFQATGSSDSVGFLTTVSVVKSIFLVIVIDAVFTLFFSGLGL